MTQEELPSNEPENERVFINPRTMTADTILTMFQKLTGREATPEEVEDLRQTMAKEDSSPS